MSLPQSMFDSGFPVVLLCWTLLTFFFAFTPVFALWPPVLFFSIPPTPLTRFACSGCSLVNVGIAAASSAPVGRTRVGVHGARVLRDDDVAPCESCENERAGDAKKIATAVINNRERAKAIALIVRLHVSGYTCIVTKGRGRQED